MALKFEGIEHAISFKFKNSDLLKEALTHRSYLNEKPNWPHPHNERLEYLGDAVLELAISESLFRKFPDSAEGQLTVLRAALVNYQALAQVALNIGLDKYVLMSRGEARDSGRAREVIFANALEALIGAMYLDRGFKSAEEFILAHIMKLLPEILEKKSYRDPKSELQEIIQEKFKLTPTYKVLDESGPAHKRTFRIGVYFNGDLVAEGTGLSKQEGETDAARKAIPKYK